MNIYGFPIGKYDKEVIDSLTEVELSEYALEGFRRYHLRHG